MKKNDILDKISPDEALEILRQITKNDNDLKKNIKGSETFPCSDSLFTYLCTSRPFDLVNPE
jgi:hypothetical protein